MGIGESDSSLPRIVDELSKLYNGDIIQYHTHKEESFSIRDNVWNKWSEDFPEFKKQILNLRKTLRKGFLARLHYDTTPLAAVISVPLPNIQLEDKNEQIVLNHFIQTLFAAYICDEYGVVSTEEELYEKLESFMEKYEGIINKKSLSWAIEIALKNSKE